jgi:hypothetical protein
LPAQAIYETGETPGDTSVFTVVDPRLVGLTFFEGVVRAISVNGEDIKGSVIRYRRDPKR